MYICICTYVYVHIYPRRALRGRWREWAELDAPEEAPLPGDWAKLPELYRVLVLKAFRPDRLVTLPLFLDTMYFFG